MDGKRGKTPGAQARAQRRATTSGRYEPLRSPRWGGSVRGRACFGGYRFPTPWRCRSAGTAQYQRLLNRLTDATDGSRIRLHGHGDRSPERQRL